ncbi:MAG: cysteine desulfurase [SAR202 cluster bacterium]|nr:cysteine desulfurase [SAR202 cluster bacterium]
MADRFEVDSIRKDFPILAQTVNGKPLVYLDNAATSQKPQCVIDSLSNYYQTINSNVHRGVHTLSQLATDDYETARSKIRGLINAESDQEIIYTRGTTESINLVAYSFGSQNVESGDEIIISGMEHHSNIVPWQLLCEQKGAVLKIIPITDEGELDINQYESMLSNKTKLVAVVHQSNALGTINSVKEITEMAHAFGAVVLIDGAQSAPHMKVDVQDIGCDFFAFSGHKLYGPTGIGVLYGRTDLLDSMVPYQSGGEMIKSVTFDKTIFNVLPHKFEAGTPDIAGAIGLGAAIDYVNDIGLEAINSYESELTAYGTDRLEQIAGLRIIGTSLHKGAVLSFTLGDIHPHDIGTILDSEGIAIRTGHHCAQPVMERYGIPATARASMSFYNTKEEIDILVAGIDKVLEIFS